MKGTLLQPVVFNGITSVAMLFSLVQIVAGGVARTTRTAEAIELLEELVEEGVIEDETIVSGVSSGRALKLNNAQAAVREYAATLVFS